MPLPCRGHYQNCGAGDRKGERSERRRERMKRGERVAAVDRCQGALRRRQMSGTATGSPLREEMTREKTTKGIAKSPLDKEFFRGFLRINIRKRNRVIT